MILSDPSGATLGTSTANGTILNDDVAIPALSIAATDSSKSEGNSGTTNFIFTVTRTGDTTAASSANWAVSGAAVNGSDFVGGTLPSGVVTFSAGQTSQQISVPVAGDTAVESTESFTVTLSSPSGATLGTSSANGTIINDDVALPVLAIAATDASKEEGDSGTTDFIFTVTRSGDTSGSSSADWAVASGSAFGLDFEGGVLPSGEVSFGAGQASQQVVVRVVGDTVVEADESFTVTLSTPSGATLGTASAIGLIQNDDIGYVGTEGEDDLIGGAADELLEGLGGDDTLVGGDGDDTLDGGEGLDTAILAGEFADFDWSFLIEPESRALTVSNTGTGETDVLYDVELLQFDDRTVDVEDLLEGRETLHALFNEATGQPIYTASLAEKLDWMQDPDIAPLSFQIAAPLGTDDDVVPVYRVYSAVFDLYLWTASEALRDSVLAEPGIGIEDQGIAFYAYEDEASGGTMAVHMLWDWNPTATYPATSSPLNILYVDEPLLPFLDRVGDAVDDMGVQFWL